uniref:Uncharacterized protein n=1 Tax=Arundo donax TaxID=35708 RepID=A0A0A8YYI9_ARUDO
MVLLWQPTSRSIIQSLLCVYGVR